MAVAVAVGGKISVVRIVNLPRDKAPLRESDVVREPRVEALPATAGAGSPYREIGRKRSFIVVMRTAIALL